MDVKRNSSKPQTPLPDLHFEGWIQSRTTIDLPRLHGWIPDAIWNNVGGKLTHSADYYRFVRPIMCMNTPSRIQGYNAVHNQVTSNLHVTHTIHMSNRPSNLQDQP
jgi:hypothetical protein